LTGGGSHFTGGANHLTGGGGRSSAMGTVWARLPRPLHGKAMVRQARQTTACYFLHADGRRERPEGETTWLVAPWESADCADRLDDGGERTGAEVGVAEEGALSVMGSHGLARACKPLKYASCPRVKSYAATLASWSQGYPRGWIHCDHTISPKPRLMKNLAAFSPGALTYLTVRAPPFLRVGVGEATLATVKLLHLISYEHMGIAQLTCVRGCTCERLDIDAHSADPRGRNVSVYVEATLPLSFAPKAKADGNVDRERRCVLALRMLRRTSSGEHRFILTRVTVGRSEKGVEGD